MQGRHCKISYNASADWLFAQRFGLGFNATYHLTDLPAFCSGDYVVIFDPHARYLPNASPAHPGLKIAFQKKDIVAQFPDAFAPFLHKFSCSLDRHYPGTLFRFPLRRATLHAAPFSSTPLSGFSGSRFCNEFNACAGQRSSWKVFGNRISIRPCTVCRAILWALPLKWRMFLNHCVCKILGQDGGDGGSQ